MFEEKFDYKEDLFETGFDYASTRKPVRKLFFRWKDVNDHTWIEMTGIEYFEFVKSEFGGKVKRIRLEVGPENVGAIRLYERNGFDFLDYRQMIIDY